MLMVKRLKVGQQVYIILNNDYILSECVYAIGDNVFIPEGFQVYVPDAQVIDFENTYATLDKAKTAFKRIMKEWCAEHHEKMSKFTLEETVNGQWEYVRNE